ncbi:MAG: hypothetical protein DMF56_19830 [Acidobacteria bacterium]|nr:MAG: hypothetical protein DMF56_19830 [Acidobacteriota bacterium]
MKAEGRKQKAEVRTTKRISHFSLLPSAFCLLPSFALFFFACAPPPPPRTTPAPPPPLTATATARRVILVSFDGLGADALASQTDLPAFEALARDGASARIIPVTPTATSCAHVTILTGAQPEVHGVIANRFHVAGTPWDETARGLEVPIEVETLVEAARAQGKRVGSVPFPTVDARTSSRTSDFGFAWTASATMPRMIHLARTDFHREWVPPTWSARPQRRASYSPVMRARIEWSVPQKTQADVDVVAYDTTNDAMENYDVFAIESANREIATDARGWFAISAQTSEALYGSWSKILSADAKLNDVAIYWGAISRTDAWPASFQTLLDSEIGFWPGVADERRGLDPSIFTDQMNRLADFMTRAQTLTIQRMPFDLLLAYQPDVDTASHTHIGDAAIVRDAFVDADHAVAAIRASLDPTRDALIITGDHGLVPIDTEVHVNALLAGKPWRAFASGHVAHLYGNEDPDAIVAMLNATGLFEQITKKFVGAAALSGTATAEVSGSHNRNSGDVVAYAKLNVQLTPSSDVPAIGQAPPSAGNHGGLNTHRELHTVLFATGAGAPNGPQGEISQTRIARFVSQLLGIRAPSAAE